MERSSPQKIGGKLVFGAHKTIYYFVIPFFLFSDFRSLGQYSLIFRFFLLQLINFCEIDYGDSMVCSFNVHLHQRPTYICWRPLPMCFTMWSKVFSHGVFPLSDHCLCWLSPAVGFLSAVVNDAFFGHLQQWWLTFAYFWALMQQRPRV